MRPSCYHDIPPVNQSWAGPSHQGCSGNAREVPHDERTQWLVLGGRFVWAGYGWRRDGHIRHGQDAMYAVRADWSRSTTVQGGGESAGRANAAALSRVRCLTTAARSPLHSIHKCLTQCRDASLSARQWVADRTHRKLEQKLEQLRQLLQQ